jgi:rod shape-determining protein MreC
MESFFSRYKNALVLIVVLVAQLLVLAVQVKRPAPGSPDQEGVSLIRYVVVSVVTPPERWVHNIGLWVRGVWTGYLDLVHVRQEDAVLKAKIERLQLEQASLAEDARQGQRLQQILEFRQHYIYKTVPAQVIGASGTDQSRTLYIDKGEKDGLAPDMPVVTGDGIVGKLKDVFDHKSLVLLVSDPTSGVGVVLESTRTRGILKGGSFGQVQVINVSPDERIKSGERIVTSGGDQIFPRGLPVGTVLRVAPDPDRDPLMDVAVQPAANLSSLEEVLVITNVGDMLSKQAARDLADSEAEGAEAKKRASDVLAERLPSRLDPKAPPDTNPDPKAGETASGVPADEVRLLTPPKPLRPDQYSPDATPQATAMTPGQRRAPVLQGGEDVVVQPSPKRPATLASETAGAGAEGHSAAAGDTASAAKRTPPVSGGTTSGATANGATALKTVNPSGSTARPVSPNGIGVGTMSGGAGATGTTATVPKPVKPTTGAAVPSGTTTSQAGTSQAGASRPLTSSTPSAGGSSSAASTGTTSSVPKTKVIMDGPISSPSTRPRITAIPANDGQAGAPAQKKGPEIVPDDGSRPPSITKPVSPKPKPPAQPAGDGSQPATPSTAHPNGGR